MTDTVEMNSTIETHKALVGEWAEVFLTKLKIKRDFLLDVVAKFTVLSNDKVGENYFFITMYGALYVMGDNRKSILGLGHDEPVMEKPVRVGMFDNEHRVKHLVHYLDRVMVLTIEGHVFAWGRNDNLAFGNHTVDRWLYEPSMFFHANGIKTIYIGGDHQGYIGKDDRLYTWGMNDSGQLGIGSFEPPLVDCPTLVSELGKVIKVAFGESHSLAINDAQSGYSWGSNSCGQLGLDHFYSVCEPREVILDFERYVDVAAFKDHSLVATNKHRIWGFGENEHHELSRVVKKDHIKIATLICSPVCLWRQPPFDGRKLKLFNENQLFLDKTEEEEFYQRFHVKAIAVECRSDSSAALVIYDEKGTTRTRVCYWKPSQEQQIWQLTGLVSFSAYAAVQEDCHETANMLHLDKEKIGCPAWDAIKAGFNKRDTANVKAILRGGRVLYLNDSTMHASGCPIALGPIGGMSRQVFDDYPASVYEHYFRFFYTLNLFHVKDINMLPTLRELAMRSGTEKTLVDLIDYTLSFHV